MKKVLAVIALAATCLAGYSQDQIDTNAPPIFQDTAGSIIDFLSHGSNYLVAPYGFYDTGIKKSGGGLAVVALVQPWFGPLLRFEYDGDKFWTMTGEAQFQVPNIKLGKVSVVPFAHGGVGAVLGGDESESLTVANYGGGIQIGFTKNFGLFAAWEKRSAFNGPPISGSRFGGGATIRF